MTECDKNKQRRFVQPVLFVGSPRLRWRGIVADNAVCIAYRQSFVNSGFRRIPNLHFRFYPTRSDRPRRAIDIQRPIRCSRQSQKPHQTILQEHLGVYAGIYQVFCGRHITRHKPTVAQFCRDSHHGSRSTRRSPTVAECARRVA